MLSPFFIPLVRRKTSVSRILTNLKNEIIGLLLIIGALFVLLSLYFYSPFDTSLNTFSTNQCSHILGKWGAFVSDFLIQFWGSSAYIFILIMFIWGMRWLVRYPVSRVTIRCLMSLLTGLGLSFLVELTHAESAHGGGALGILLAHFFVWEQAGALIMLVLVSLLSVACFIGALDLSFILYLFKTKEPITNKQTHTPQKEKPHRRFFSTSMSFSYNQEKKEEDSRVNRWDNPTTPSDVNESPYQAPSPSRNPDESKSKNPIASTVFEPDSPLDKGEEFASSGNPTDIQMKRYQNSDSYQYPPVTLLDPVRMCDTLIDQDVLLDMGAKLQSVLEEFGIKGDILKIRQGPVVTLFEFKPAPGVKSSRVISLSEDIARSMSAFSARIATISGQNAIGIELPNPKRQTVYLKDLLETDLFHATTCKLPLILGKDINGEPMIADLARMPHLLVAGTTGSGKSVAINVMILSILYKMPSHMCKFIMIDPKMLELSVYDGIPHLLCPVVTDSKKAVIALKWAVKEMENRYRCMSQIGVRNIDGYNARLLESSQTGDMVVRRIQTGFDEETGKPLFENQVLDLAPFPYIVVVVDEMADLMLVAGKDIESAVQRLAQMARAAGIHLIMATQRPSVDVITGTIKANFPTRMSFQVTSRIDSRTILGEQGAEHLLGQGDMLYMGGASRLMRIHGPFVKDSEVEKIVTFLKDQGDPTYIESITEEEEMTVGSDKDSDKDELYRQAIDFIRREKKVSTSFIQRQFQIGYNRAARIVEQMEKEGLISAASSTGKREVL